MCRHSAARVRITPFGRNTWELAQPHNLQSLKDTLTEELAEPISISFLLTDTTPTSPTISSPRIMADDAAAEEVPVTFNVKSSNDSKFVITMPLSATVLDLKDKLAGAEYANIPPESQRLIYSGRVLKDPDTLSSYKLKEGNTIHLVKGAASNQRQNPASSSTAAASSGSASASASTGVPTNLAAGTGNNPLAGLTGARYAGFAQLPGAGMFGPDGGVSLLDSRTRKTLGSDRIRCELDGPPSRP